MYASVKYQQPLRKRLLLGRILLLPFGRRILQPDLNLSLPSISSGRGVMGIRERSDTLSFSGA
jgi:hypothetical protein